MHHRRTEEIFTAVKNNEMDVNTEHDGICGKTTLIHELIRITPDEDLPAILTILMDHKVELEKKDGLQVTPLAEAASHLKIEAVNFLLEKKVNVNDSSNRPALVCAVTLIDESQSLKMVKTLVTHGANIDAKTDNGETAIGRSIEAGHPNVLRYLISQNANLYLKSLYMASCRDVKITPITIAYLRLAEIKNEIFKTNSHYNTNHVDVARTCFKLVADPMLNYLYHIGISSQNVGEQLKIELSNIITNLIGENEFRGMLKMVLNNAVLYPILQRITFEREQLRTCQTDFLLEKLNLKGRKPTSPFYRFFAQGLLPKIFSYVHEAPVINDYSNIPVIIRR